MTISLIVLLVMVLLLTYVSNSTYENSFKTAKANLGQINNNVLDSLNDLLDANLGMVKTLALEEIVKEFLAGQGQPLASFLKSQVAVRKGLSSLVIFNPQGRVVAGFGQNGRDITGLDVAERPYAQESLAGREYISRQVLLSKATGDMIFVIAAPVRGDAGQILGGAAVVLDWKAFIERHVLPVKIGEHGYVAIIDSQGLAISHPQAKFTDFSAQAFAQKCLREKNGFQSYELEGQKKFMVFGQEERTGFTVTSIAPLNDLQAFAHGQTRTLLLAGVLAFMDLVAAILLILRREMSPPLRA